MYQFPDSSEVMGQPDDIPVTRIKKRPRYKIILIANSLVVLFIAAIVWFFFFFEAPLAEFHNTLDTQHTTGDFTPIIMDDSVSDVNHLPAKTMVISTITETATDNKQIKTLSGDVAIIANEKLQHSQTIEAAVSRSNKPTAQQKTENKPLSAIDRITYELMKSKTAQASQLSNTAITNSVTSIAIKHPDQVKKEPLSFLDRNQVIRKKTVELPLKQLLDQAERNLDVADQQLIRTLNTVDSLSSKKKITSDVISNTVIDNSIEFKKTSDIDKIMAAMGGVKKTPEIEAIEKIDTTVKKLLNSDAIKHKQVGSYIKDLQSETEENRKERRTITVKKGEKLWDLAVRAYGDGNQYKIILQANPFLKNNPDLIKAGITLRAPVIDYSNKSK